MKKKKEKKPRTLRVELEAKKRGKTISPNPHTLVVGRERVYLRKLENLDSLPEGLTLFVPLTKNTFGVVKVVGGVGKGKIEFGDTVIECRKNCVCLGVTDIQHALLSAYLSSTLRKVWFPPRSPKVKEEKTALSIERWVAEATLKKFAFSRAPRGRGRTIRAGVKGAV